MMGRLVERDHELAMVAGVLERARAGEGGVLVFSAPAGIGKTVLLDAGVGLASGFRLLRGSGGELERELSFGLVRELFEPVLRGATAARRRAWLSGAAGTAAAVLGAPGGQAADVPSVVFGLYWLVAAIADDQPVFLVADDLQWSDPASLRWLVYLARRLVGLRVAVLAATRPVDAQEPGLVGLLEATDGVRVCRPAPLSMDAIGEVIAERLRVAPDAAFTRACHAATGGNGLLLRELLETARDEGLAPDAGGAGRVDALAGERLRCLVLGRVARLGPDAGALARAVAVLGDGCELRHARELAGIDDAAAIAAVRALVGAGVFADRQPLAFAHPLLRSAIYLDLPAPVRAAEHGRAAALLASAGAGLEQAVAHHLQAAEPVGAPWALAALQAAARLAMAGGAPELAARQLRRALDEQPAAPVRAELLRELGNALARLGDPDAIAVLEQALALTTDASSRLQIVEASLDPLVGAGRFSEARALLLDVLAGTDAGDVETVTQVSGRLAVIRAFGGGAEVDEPVSRLWAARDGLDPTTFAGRYAAGGLAMLGALCEGTVADVRELSRCAVGSAATHEVDARTGRPLPMALFALALAGEPQLALSRSEAAIAVSRERGSLMGQALGLAWRARIHQLAGNVSDAENEGRAALAVAADTALSNSASAATGAVVWALTERGETREAHELLDASPAATGFNDAALGCLRMRLLIIAHRHADALALLATITKHAEGAGWRSSELLPWRALGALAHLGAGDVARTRQLADEDLAGAERFGSAREIGRALRVRARIERGRNATATLQTAVDRLREGDATLELAYALIDYGAALRRTGERARSRPPLYEGLELAHQCGASALVAHAGPSCRPPARVPAP